MTLDNTNFAAASWTPYTSSNITANVGTNQGLHTVWVGLRGLPANAQQTWNAVTLDLDLRPPTLVVTNATNVMVPLLQLQGYANEDLASLTFDLANANGTLSNQTGFLTGATFDTNSFSYTNVTFKCFDLALASGLNTVTLHAADLAGNVTSASVLFNLDYALDFARNRVTAQGTLIMRATSVTIANTFHKLPPAPAPVTSQVVGSKALL